MCNPGSHRCNGGLNDGVPCTAPGAGDTSPDCPPLAESKVADLPVTFALTTGTAIREALDLSDQQNVFCGFCRDPDSGFFGEPAVACTSNADCSAQSTATSCQQATSGAFASPSVQTLTLTGTPAGNMADHAPHGANLVGTFCIPPTYGPADGGGDLPGPGAITLSGTVTLR